MPADHRWNGFVVVPARNEVESQPATRAQQPDWSETLTA